MAAPTPLRLAWATDVHLNFLSREELTAFCSTLAATASDAVLFTGDIAEATSLRPLLETVARAIERPLYFVLGNHDFYRGSIAAVRTMAAELSATSPWLRWLPSIPHVELSPDTGLVGHDGWADARLGDYERSPVMLNDYVLIQELTSLDRRRRREALHRLGDDAAAYLRSVLPLALERYRRVIVATHVPPFKEACWHEGQISNDDWLPHFTCKATGEVLREAALRHPERRIEVLCGHTHGAGVAEILPNLVVRTGGAEYGEPAVQGVIATA
ncbi:metallophosphoesterase [Sorangium sp. So ce1504]|uniref:metallophosphoesterase family protein n=1 Tax=Sorangium sp. So ce1504 TaxID=3133337 RepID=UPI003F63686D